MKKRKREIENCEPAVEQFLKSNPQLGEDGWFLQRCRMSNGGNPPYHQGPFLDDQLFLNIGELLTTYPSAGMETYATPGMSTDDVYFPVMWGALRALSKSDPNDPGWLYYEGKWVRL